MMSDLRKAVLLALDALVDAVPCTAEQVTDQDKAIDALRAALESTNRATHQKVKSKSAKSRPNESHGMKHKDPITEPEQSEPVAWMKKGWGPDCGPFVELYTSDEMGWRDRKEWTPLYTTPPRREPLTEAQALSLWRTSEFRGSGGQADWFAEGIRAAEKHHGIGGKT